MTDEDMKDFNKKTGRYYSNSKRGRKRENFFVGSGITPLTQEKYVNFGTLVLHKKSLNQSNILSVRYPSMAWIKELPAQKVSDDFVSIINDILDEQKIGKTYQKLSEHEKSLFCKLCKRSKLDDQLGLQYKEHDINEDLERFDLVRGMVVAGNNSPEVLKELRDLVAKFINWGIMTKREGKPIIQDITNILGVV